MFNDFAVRVEAEDVDTRGFLASPVEVTHVYKGQIAFHGNAFHLAGYAPGLFYVTHDAVESIREKRVVLDVGPGHETRQQVGSALIEDLVVDNVERALNVISCHDLAF